MRVHWVWVAVGVGVGYWILPKALGAVGTKKTTG